MHVTELDHSIDVAVGEDFGVKLESHASAGGRWKISPPREIETLSQVIEPARSFGGRGKMLQKFRCVAEGNYSIEFELGRPWEASGRLFRVMVKCRP